VNVKITNKVKSVIDVAFWILQIGQQSIVGKKCAIDLHLLSG